MLKSELLRRPIGWADGPPESSRSSAASWCVGPAIWRWPASNLGGATGHERFRHSDEQDEATESGRISSSPGSCRSFEG